jgi:maltose/moltooligosaccharide transporter
LKEIEIGERGHGGMSPEVLRGRCGMCAHFVNSSVETTEDAENKRTQRSAAETVCLTLAGIAMLGIPSIHNRLLLLLPMIGVGLAWASIMGNPYVMLAGCVPAERVGVYMGIFNMFIVIP